MLPSSQLFEAAGEEGGGGGGPSLIGRQSLRLLISKQSPPLLTLRYETERKIPNRTPK